MIKHHPKNLLLFFSSFIIISTIVLYSLQGHIFPIAGAIVLVYLTRPIQTQLKYIGLSSHAAALSVSLTIFLIMILIALYGIPLVINEFSRFIQYLPQSIETSYSMINQYLSQYDIQIQNADWNQVIKRIIDQQDLSALQTIPKLLTNTIQHFLDLILFFTNLLFIPLFFFFTLKNGEDIVHQVIELSPPSIRNDVVAFTQMLHNTLSAWITGQGTMIIILCILYASCLSLLGIPYAITLGILTGLLYLIPVAGFLLSLSITAITTISSTGLDISILVKVLTLYISIQLIESFILSPYLIGNKLGINLPTMLLAIMIGGGLFGAAGIILAIPTASLIKRTIQYIVQNTQDDWIYD